MINKNNTNVNINIDKSTMKQLSTLKEVKEQYDKGKITKEELAFLYKLAFYDTNSKDNKIIKK